MPYRKALIVKGEIYHVFNRSVAGQQIFPTQKFYQRALEVLYFYSFSEPGIRFSHYNQFAKDQREDFLNRLKTQNKKQIQMLVFCLMPNHFHFLIKEIVDKGITTFMRNFQNSLAKFFNLRTGRSGALFQAMFKAVRIESDEQLIHVCRYIHLNPLSSYLIKDAQELEDYPWCSFPDYIGHRQSDLIEKEIILAYFNSVQQFKEFTFNQIDYQRKLENIKHLILE